MEVRAMGDEAFSSLNPIPPFTLFIFPFLSNIKYFLSNVSHFIIQMHQYSSVSWQHGFKMHSDKNMVPMLDGYSEHVAHART